ncbi:MAG: hypothetical protein JWN38_12 [Candidatus Saccharibacteria bacterium]|nr:hypothetical protein [Candidatus Saccharibacteria bacterium]
MSDIQQTVTRKDVDGVDEAGRSAHQTVREVHTRSSTDAQSTIVNIVWFIYAVVAVFLALRFVLLALGANAANGFVSFVYNVSRIFSAPFDSMFSAKSVEAVNTQSVIQPSVIVAIIVYALIAWGIVKLVTISSRKANI